MCTAANTPALVVRRSLAAGLPACMPQTGEVKHGGEPPFGGGIKRRLSPMIRRDGARGPMRRGLTATLLGAGLGWRALTAATAAMRIRTGSAASTSELAGYLRRCECIAEFIGEWTLDVAVRPGLLSERHARIELEGYLRVWEAMNPNVSVERLTPRPVAS